MFSSKSVRALEHFCLSFDVFVVVRQHVLNYYGYNEEPNGMLSRQNYVTFDFDDSTSILMGFSIASLRFPLHSTVPLFLMEQKFMTANNPKIEYTIHVSYTQRGVVRRMAIK